MKIYFASQSFYPYIGGVSTYLLALEKEMVKKGNEVVEVHLRLSGEPNEDEIDGIEIHRVPREPIDREVMLGYSKFKEAVYKECHYNANAFAKDCTQMEGYEEFNKVNDYFLKFFSQLVENRTLRNYNMHYYDSTVPDFVPQTYEPEPWGWYPLPGKPSDVMTTVQVPDLSESLDEMQFIIQIAEKAVGATSTQAGSVEDRERTLGEVQLALANAQDRVRSIAVYYTEAWKDFGLKYIRMLEASRDKLDPITIAKEGRLGKKMYQKEISPKQYSTKSGYKVEVSLLGEKQEADLDNLQKLDASLRAMPLNVALRRIYNRKLLEFANLSVEQIQQVEEFESQNPTPVVTGEEGESRTKEDEGAGIPEVPIMQGAVASGGGVE